MEKKYKVKYEFFKFESTTANNFFTNLVLNNPANVKFYCYGPAGIGRALINNVYYLDAFAGVVSGGANYDYQLNLNNNINEIDITNYNILLKPQTTLFVICKYIEEQL